MKTLLFGLIVLVLPVFSSAATVLLKDGTKFEAAKIEENGDKLAMETKYGNISANKADVENLEALGFGNKPGSSGPKTTGLEFISGQLPDGSIKVDYYFNLEKTGTQLLSQAGVILNSEGKILDGTYKEFYSDGKLKKEKTVIDGLNNGTFKTFYPDGTLQSESYFIGNKVNGGYKYYSDTGKLIIERNYINGIANGYFRDFDENGTVKSQTQYVNGDQKQIAGEPVLEKTKPLEFPKFTESEDKSGIAGKEKTLFVGGEFFTVGGADKEWKENFKVIMRNLDVLVDSASGDLTSNSGLGVNVGANLGVYRRSPIYLMGSYVKGPSADLDIALIDSVLGTGSYNEMINTYFYRLMLGYKLVVPVQGKHFFTLDFSAGFGGGTIKDESTLTLTGFGTTKSSDEDTWTGFTWSVGPTFS